MQTPHASDPHREAHADRQSHVGSDRVERDLTEHSLKILTERERSQTTTTESDRKNTNQKTLISSSRSSVNNCWRSKVGGEGSEIGRKMKEGRPDIAMKHDIKTKAAAENLD